MMLTILKGNINKYLGGTARIFNVCGTIVIENDIFTSYRGTLKSTDNVVKIVNKRAYNIIQNLNTENEETWTQYKTKTSQKKKVNIERY